MVSWAGVALRGELFRKAQVLVGRRLEGPGAGRWRDPVYDERRVFLVIVARGCSYQFHY